MSARRALVPAFALALFASAASAQSNTPPDANPGRPTVSSPATLTPVGFLQLEIGVSSATHSLFFSSRAGAGAVAKLALNSRIEASAQYEPLVRSRIDLSGDSTTDPGGIGAGVQVVLVPGAARRPTIAIGYQHSLADGSSPDGDTGSSRQSAVALVSVDVHGFHVDANGLVSDALVDSRRIAQYGETLCVSHAIGRAAIAGEVWRFSQPFLAGHQHTAGTLWALSFALRPNLVVDGGVSRGVRETSTRWQVMTGVTYVVPARLW